MKKIDHVKTTSKQPLIIVKPKGRFANQIFQAMIAFEIASRVPEAHICGIDIKEIGLHLPKPDNMDGPNLIQLGGHSFNLDFVSYLIKNNIYDGVQINGWGMDLSHFVNLNSYKNKFNFAGKPIEVSDKEVLIHIRTGDSLMGWHPRYFPLQFDFYEKIIEEVGLKPVFIGEMEDSNYIKTLKNKFAGAKFLPTSTSFIDDFETIRHAKNIVLSISSFSFLAAFFSNASAIHMPVAGLFDPRSSNIKANLLPIMDNRFNFYSTNFLIFNEREKTKFDDWFNLPSGFEKLSRNQLIQIIRDGFFK